MHRRRRARQRRGDRGRVFADQIHRPAAPLDRLAQRRRSPGPCPGRRGSGGSAASANASERDHACSRRSSPWSRSRRARRRGRPPPPGGGQRPRSERRPARTASGSTPRARHTAAAAIAFCDVVRAAQAQLATASSGRSSHHSSPARSDSAAPGPAPKHRAAPQPRSPRSSTPSSSGATATSSLPWRANTSSFARR